MKQFFLYRLFKHSKWGFAFIIIFLAGYAVTYFKKMDMVFFPYNSMYAIDFNKTNAATTYALKINNRPVRITRNLYWKKDFLETSLNGYCRYLKHDRNVFLDDYLHYRFADEKLRQNLLDHLTPAKAVARDWPAWYARAAGYDMPPAATIEFMQYDFVMQNEQALLKDSSSIYKTVLP